MNSERISSTTSNTGVNRSNLYKENCRNDIKNQPINAVTFDVVTLSDTVPDRSVEYNWLISMIAKMPDEDVGRKMNSFIKSFNDIDEGVTEKVIMEAL